MAALIRPVPAIVAALAFGLSACSGGTSDDAGNTADPVALVTLAPVAEGDLTAHVTLYGVAEAGTQGRATLSASADAVVAQIVAPVGAAVHIGDVIARLSPAPSTRLDLAKASADARVADAAYARAQRLRGDGLVGDAEVETARAAAAAAAATRATLGNQASGLTLRAPSSGFIDTVAANPGDQVSTGAAIATIVRPGSLRAHFGADPATARALHRGAPIRIDATTGRAAFSVLIDSVSPIVDPQTRLAPVYADLPAESGLNVGETLAGAVSVGGGAGLMIPYAALLDDGGQSYVFVVAKGVAHRHDVAVGATDGDRVAIAKGVAAGDRVVVDGGTGVDDGMKVRTR